MTGYDEIRNQVKNIIGVGAIGTCAIFAAVLFGMCTYKINPGYAGVVYNMDGGIEDETLGQGFHFVLPWKHVTEYPVSTETVYYSKADSSSDDDKDSKDTSINISTKDGKQVNVSITYAYHMDVDMLPTVFEKFRGKDVEDIEDTYMKNEMYQAVNEVTSQYSLMQLVGDQRPTVNTEIMKKFKESLEPYGIVIETFNLSEVVPDEQTKTAIQAVIDAQNALEKSKVDKEKAEVDADTKRVTAQGEADARLIEAESTAKANAKLQETLTPLIVEQRKIDKWDGKQPNIVSGNSTLMIQP